MRAVDIIQKKRDGGTLTPDEIRFFVAGVTDFSLPDYQVAALLMAILLRGMTPEETAVLTDAMVNSGARVDLSDIPGIKVDKHSTGGVGDKTSIVIAPLVAACGGVVPMMSGRGLGHTGGTLDKLESIPGFRTNLSISEMRASLAAIGCALIGQTAQIAPADKKLYALRDVTGTIESVPLISASIMSKKIAEGIGALVLDVKSGKGAFMKTPADARTLAESLVAIGKSAGVHTQAVITAMNWPIGQAVGNANEIVECIELLKGDGRPDLLENSLELSERMLIASGVAKDRADAAARCRRALDSGEALERLRAIIERQGGDPRVIDDYTRMPRAPEEHVMRADADGFVTQLDAGLIGRAVVVLGGGRDKVEDEIDPAVGIMIAATVGDAVRAGDPVLRVQYRSEERLEDAQPLLSDAMRIGEAPPPRTPLVIDEVL
ncbi:MAG TPA: thymidine phosphorylase [Vicinamibacterales bacterium]|nr:thymidine phosphorylase [Vicinamibacterales bacterium]